MISSETLPTISAQRVLLRSLRDDDRPALFEVFSDPETMRYWSSPPWTKESQASEYLEEIRTGLRTRSFFQWGLARRSDDHVLGTCTLFAYHEPCRRAEVGFILGRRHWGQGLMTEGFQALLRHSFEELGLRRLEADTDPRNTGSIRLLERMGFQREGLMRERWEVGGEIQDSVLFGLLRREWMAEQEPRGGSRKPPQGC